MPITHDELGRRLRTAREANGLTQDDVARRLGVSRPTLVQMEAGKRKITSVELEKLAYLYGRDIGDFVGDAFSEMDPIAAIFRAQPDVAAQPEVLDRVRATVALGRELGNLERAVGISREAGAIPAYPLPTPATKWDAVRQGEEVAIAERRRLGLDASPIADIVTLLETQGLRTGLVALPDDVSGFTLNDRRNGLFVVVNEGHNTERRRFSFAHEYGHALLDRDHLSVVSRTGDHERLDEVRANAFAAWFLLPEDGVRAFVGRLGKGMPSRIYSDVFDGRGASPVEGRTKPGSQDLQLYDVALLAHNFAVSVLATLFRLRNLRLLTEEEFARFRADEEAGKADEIARLLDLSKVDERAERAAFNRRYLGLALEAYRREAITRAKLDEVAMLLAVPRTRIERLLDESGMGGRDGDVLMPEA